MNSDADTPERNPFLEAVGRITIAGAQLDNSLRTLLAAVAFEPTLLVSANAEGTARLIELCELALTVHTAAPDDTAEIKACLARARDLKEKRNQVVHSIFMHVEEGGGLQAFKPLRKRLGMSSSPITVAEMEATALKIEELRVDMSVAGWNARCAQSGMDRISRSAPNADTTISKD
ncbi:hypothetical protein [Streptomyces goshikiensis]|uniref:hypothetical protein n=1 Tax=Streptomyces goshikiensis TaxID=1942 RepID=UPI0036611C7D